MRDAERRFEALYTEHGEAVLRYARRRTGAAAADDVVAETFVIAWRKLEKAPEDPLGWLLAIARRTLANQRRGERRRDALLERLKRDPTAAPLATDVSPMVDGAVTAALAGLSARDRELLLLIHWDGLTPAEAQRVLGVTPVAFRARLHRARNRLAAALEAPHDSPALRTPTPQPTRGAR